MNKKEQYLININIDTTEENKSILTTELELILENIKQRFLLRDKEGKITITLKKRSDYEQN